MDFISILNSTDTNRHIPPVTMEDIRIRELFSENVVRVMCDLPGSTDLLSRQKVFSYLITEGCDEQQELVESLQTVNDLFLKLDESESERQKDYVLVAIVYQICVFYKKASEIKCDVGFFDDFRKYFKNIFNAEIYTEAEALYQKLRRSVLLELKDDRVIVRDKKVDGFIEKLCNCAREMGIKYSRNSIIPQKINPELAESIASVYPELFSEFKAFCSKYKDYPDRAVLSYIDELQFYISNVQLVKKYSALGIPFCYPELTEDDSLCFREAHDITLLAKDCNEIIPNDIDFDEKRPVFFLAGANGGGKTTYLRACGVNTVLALNGCPVPSRKGSVSLLDSVLTHFPCDERFDLEGRFIDEHNRVRDLLKQTGRKSLVLLNETYATTNEQKATEMTCSLACEIKNKGQYCIYVTHQKKALELDIPVLCCVIDEENSNRRTYKIRPVKEATSSYAKDILEKYKLSDADLKERFGI